MIPGSRLLNPKPQTLNSDMSLGQRIEAILFAGAKPYGVKRLAEFLDASQKEVEEALTELDERLKETGIMLQRSGSEVQLVTQPQFADEVKQVAREEVIGELTRPSLEALTILAYRGPLTRPEIEQIRGVHSSLILRNLQLRGLVEEMEEVRLGQPVYAVTFDFIRHLGLKSLEDLPQYEELRGHENVVDVLKDLEEESDEDKGSAADSQQPTADLAV
jgi:segregation and condensation protein B